MKIRDIRQISLIGLFIGVLIMGLFVTNAGDDFFYASFCTKGIGHFFRAHAEHYMHSNGRCIVHLLASLFLKMPHIIWKIFNAAMWVMLALNIYRLISIYVTDASKLKFIMFMLCGGFLTIHIEMAKESTLWLTGSFNYTYPLLLFMWYWYMLFTNSAHSTRKMCIVGFLTAASMEQESALTVILTLGYVCHTVFIRRKNLSPDLKKIMLAVIIGAVSLFLAPGNIHRMGDEIGGSGGTLENIVNGIDFMLNYYISSDYMIWINLICLLFCALYLYRRNERYALYALPFAAVIFYITNHSGDFEWLGAFYTIIFALSRIYYFAVLLRTVYVFCLDRRNPIILMGLCFGIFSCAFIVFSPTLGPRVILLFEVMIIITAVMTAAEVLKKQTWTYLTVHIAVLALSVWNVCYISHGFYINMNAYNENVRLIEEWKQNPNGELIQKQYRNDAFEHSMPYNSEYHEMRYKEFFGISEDVKINWK